MRNIKPIWRLMWSILLGTVFGIACLFFVLAVTNSWALTGPWAGWQAALVFIGLTILALILLYWWYIVGIKKDREKELKFWKKVSDDVTEKILKHEKHLKKEGQND